MLFGKNKTKAYDGPIDVSADKLSATAAILKAVGIENAESYVNDVAVPSSYKKTLFEKVDTSLGIKLVAIRNKQNKLTSVEVHEIDIAQVPADRLAEANAELAVVFS